MVHIIFDYFLFYKSESQIGCVVFDIKCVMPELYESNWCVIGDTPGSSFSRKYQKLIIFIQSVSFLTHFFDLYY